MVSQSIQGRIGRSNSFYIIFIIHHLLVRHYNILGWGNALNSLSFIAIKTSANTFSRFFSRKPSIKKIDNFLTQSLFLNMLSRSRNSSAHMQLWTIAMNLPLRCLLLVAFACRTIAFIPSMQHGKLVSTVRCAQTPITYAPTSTDVEDSLQDLVSSNVLKVNTEKGFEERWCRRIDISGSMKVLYLSTK